MWACYRIYLEAKTPIHIGYGIKLGMVERTRYYIPGRNIWGALTTLAAKCIMKDYSLKVYQEIGKFLNRNVRLSYFYPIEYENEKTNVQQVLSPCYAKGGLEFGVCREKKRISLERFEKRFISSFVSTTIDKTSKTAEEGSLHEIEFIKNRIELNNKVYPTVLMGYSFVKEPCKNLVEGKEVKLSFANSIRINETEINEMWIGGERNYGFGNVEVFKVEKLNKKEINLFDSGVMANIANEQLTISGGNGHLIALSHVDIDDLNIKSIKGDVEPFIGREWGGKGTGQKISRYAKICISPGSYFITDSNITINEFGVWSSISPTGKKGR